jgi:hypothetical protein
MSKRSPKSRKPKAPSPTELRAKRLPPHPSEGIWSDPLSFSRTFIVEDAEYGRYGIDIVAQEMWKEGLLLPAGVRSTARSLVIPPVYDGASAVRAVRSVIDRAAAEALRRAYWELSAPSSRRLKARSPYCKRLQG